MSFSTLVFFIIGIALFFSVLDRDSIVRPSKALWVPVVWLWIIGSRVPSIWLAGRTDNGSVEATFEGKFTDAFIFACLVALGVMILLGRKHQTLVLLKGSGPVLIYFAYCLISVSWSPFTAVALKRWIKSVGDLIMVLIILTDAEPTTALRRIYSRVGFVLLPASLLMIRYSDLGRGFDPTTGNPWNIGVTTNKNSLGLITFVLALGALWNFFTLLRAGDQPNRGRHLLAQGALLGLSLAVLGQAHSATSTVCFVVGSVLMILTSFRAVKYRPARIHAVVLTMFIVTACGMVFGADEYVLSLLGKNATLTGRTEIWQTVIPLARNSIVGAGFESFWNAVNPTLNRDSESSFET